MLRVKQLDGTWILVPAEVEETLKAGGYDLLGEETPGVVTGRAVLSTAFYSTNTWIFVTAGMYGRPGFLDYYPKDTIVRADRKFTKKVPPTRSFRIRKPYKPLTIK